MALIVDEEKIFAIGLNLFQYPVDPKGIDRVGFYFKFFTQEMNKAMTLFSSVNRKFFQSKRNTLDVFSRAGNHALLTFQGNSSAFITTSDHVDRRRKNQ